MAVTLTVSKTVTGAQVSDVLEGGGTGLDFGDLANGAYAPIIDQVANTGRQSLYFRHDAVIDPVIDVKFYISDYVGSTGFTYGGVVGNSQDLSDLIGMGTASGSSKNNIDGLSGGLWIDMDWQVNNTNAFDITTRPARVKIFGDNATDGTSPATAFDVHVDAMSYWNGSAEVDATTPVTGTIGKSDDTVLGNRAHIFTRMYLPQNWTQGGIAQAAFITQYTYTA